MSESKLVAVASCTGLTVSPDGEILSSVMDFSPSSSLPSVLKATRKEPLRPLADFCSIGYTQAKLMRQ